MIPFETHFLGLPSSLITGFHHSSSSPLLSILVVPPPPPLYEWGREYHILYIPYYLLHIVTPHTSWWTLCKPGGNALKISSIKEFIQHCLYIICVKLEFCLLVVLGLNCTGGYLNASYKFALWNNHLRSLYNITDTLCVHFVYFEPTFGLYTWIFQYTYWHAFYYLRLQSSKWQASVTIWPFVPEIPCPYIELL